MKKKHWEQQLYTISAFFVLIVIVDLQDKPLADVSYRWVKMNTESIMAEIWQQWKIDKKHVPDALFACLVS
jgi:hypothetical protein